MRDWVLDAVGAAMIWGVGIFVLAYSDKIEAALVALLR
jgi:hypothetical protein